MKNIWKSWITGGALHRLLERKRLNDGHSWILFSRTENILGSTLTPMKRRHSCLHKGGREIVVLHYINFWSRFSGSARGCSVEEGGTKFGMHKLPSFCTHRDSTLCLQRSGDCKVWLVCAQALPQFYWVTFTHLSMLLKVYCVPCFVSISKSKERVVVVPRAKFTKAISSKRMWTGGLCT